MGGLADWLPRRGWAAGGTNHFDRTEKYCLTRKLVSVVTCADPDRVKMFCISDRSLYPTYHHRQLLQPATVFLPAAYEQQNVATRMSMMPCGQTLMTNFQPPVFVPPASSSICEYRQETPGLTGPAYGGGLSPAKRKSAAEKRVRDGTAASYRKDRRASGVTSFRIADIMDWRVASSGRRVDHRASPVTTTTTEIRQYAATSASIVRPWDERRRCSSSSNTSSFSSSSSSLTSEAEERNVDDEEAEEIDVDDAGCSLPGTATSDAAASSERDVCPLGALLRMTNQTKFDECANRLQECFTDGQFIKCCCIFCHCPFTLMHQIFPHSGMATYQAVTFADAQWVKERGISGAQSAHSVGPLIYAVSHTCSELCQSCCTHLVKGRLRSNFTLVLL